MNTLMDGTAVFLNNWQLTLGILALVTVIIFPLRPRVKLGTQPASISTGIFLACFIFVSIVLRLAFVSKAILPSYFDSAQHYAIIKNIMANGPSQIITLLDANYYHLGFHFITASLASIFQTEITMTMLVLGQVMLGILPLLFFFIVKNITNSNRAGMFTAVLSAFGWYMPGHAVDWGKYPASMSIGMILFLLHSVYTFVQNKDELQTGKRIFLLVTLGLSILLITAFVHSRSVIVFGIVVVSWMASISWHKLPQSQKQFIFFFLLIIVITEIIVIQRHAVLSLLFDPYLNKGIVATSLVVFLSTFAYKSYPQLTFIATLTVSLLLGNLFIPVMDIIPGHTQLTLMDRPYVEMMLFMPLSLLGGLGVAGLDEWIKSSYQKYAVLIGIGLILIYSMANYEYYPSVCCVIVGNDDMAAMAWMDNQLPVEARIGVASTGLRVVAANVPEGDVGVDAGIWITPLIGRGTILLPYDAVFDQQEVLGLLCMKKIDYLFVGEIGQPFDVASLDIRPEWYRPLLSMSRTRIYEVIGCNSLF